RANVMRIGWRTHRVHPFRMTGRFTFRMKMKSREDPMLSDLAPKKKVGWGARIRTWEWRNQNPTISNEKSTRILKNSSNSTHYVPISYVGISECRLPDHAHIRGQCGHRLALHTSAFDRSDDFELLPPQ